MEGVLGRQGVKPVFMADAAADRQYDSETNLFPPTNHDVFYAIVTTAQQPQNTAGKEQISRPAA